MSSPNFIHGRYSKNLPARLSARYEESCRDTNLLVLREDIALLDARLDDLLAKVDTGESGRLWSELRSAYAGLQDAKRQKDTEALSKALSKLGEIITAGSADEQCWGEIINLLDQRRKLVESERKRLIETQQMLTIEQALMLVASVVDTVRKYVTDRSALASISQDLARLVAIEDGRKA